MLVLSRKKNESIVIDSTITVTVVEIRGDKVRLGIVAPRDVPVHRQEVYESIHGDQPKAISDLASDNHHDASPDDDESPTDHHKDESE